LAVVACGELLQAVTAAARAAVISTAGLLIFTWESPIALSELLMVDAGRTRWDYRLSSVPGRTYAAAKAKRPSLPKPCRLAAPVGCGQPSPAVWAGSGWAPHLIGCVLPLAGLHVLLTCYLGVLPTPDSVDP
jgi:hypothetical protein